MSGLEFFHLIYPKHSELTIVDAGAHVGNSVAAFIEMFPSASIHAFEPVPQNFVRLEKRFRGFNNVHCNETALGEFNGELSMLLNTHDATHSVFEPDPTEISLWADGNVSAQKEIKVSQQTLTALVERANITQIDVLKMDVQGGELAILKGSKNLLNAQSIKCIFAEVEFRALYKDQPLAWDIHAELSSHGYEFVNFLCPKVTKGGVLSWADAVYVCKETWSHIASIQAREKAIEYL
jgi:FkbM family methyltransferase